MSRYPMTKEGEISLRQELQKLKSKDRNSVVQAIAEAREHGDLKEMLNIMRLKNSRV